MPENRTKRSSVAPAVLIVIATVSLLLGFGRCGFLQPVVRPADDLGFTGACCLILGLILLIVGLVWLSKRRKNL